jgi:crotonobetainyl-CoA:carnitine CoA-transferase CaiB-like acyl-CoA transferase
MDEELPYTGLKVFDATQGVAGPHCAMLLAQHGADVVKVEPLEGDWLRYSGKRYGDLTSSLLVFGRGKRSLALNLKTPEGKDIAQRLAFEADVVLESFRPGVMARFGLDYESIRKRNPTVVYASTSGFGAVGPHRDRPVTDMVMQGFTGWMVINRDKDDIPQRIRMVAVDVMTGLYGFQAVSAALYRRALKGVGAHIEISMMEAAGAFQAAKIIEHHLEGADSMPLGAPIGSYRTADGHINMNARSQKHFAALCELIGRPELTADPRFVDREDRIENADALDDLLREVFPARSTAEWAEALGARDIIHAPVQDYDGYLASEQTAAAKAVSWIDVPGVGQVPLHNIPGLARITDGDALATAPHIGEHSREILRGLGLDDAAVDALVEKGAVGDFGKEATPE